MYFFANCFQFAGVSGLLLIQLTSCALGASCGRCSAIALVEHGDELGPSREACRVAEAKQRALGRAP